MPALYRLREQDFGGGNAGYYGGGGGGVALAGLQLEQDRINDGGRKQLGEDAGASSGVCAATSAGDCMPSWPGRDRWVKQSSGEDAVSRWHGDGRERQRHGGQCGGDRGGEGNEK